MWKPARSYTDCTMHHSFLPFCLVLILRLAMFLPSTPVLDRWLHSMFCSSACRVNLAGPRTWIQATPGTTWYRSAQVKENAAWYFTSVKCMLSRACHNGSVVDPERIIPDRDTNILIISDPYLDHFRFKLAKIISLVMSKKVGSGLWCGAAAGSGSGTTNNDPTWPESCGSDRTRITRHLCMHLR